MAPQQRRAPSAQVCGVFALFLAGAHTLLFWGLLCHLRTRAGFIAAYYTAAAACVAAGLRGRSALQVPPHAETQVLLSHAAGACVPARSGWRRELLAHGMPRLSAATSCYVAAATCVAATSLCARSARHAPDSLHRNARDYAARRCIHASALLHDLLLGCAGTLCCECCLQCVYVSYLRGSRMLLAHDVLHKGHCLATRVCGVTSNLHIRGLACPL